MHYSCFETLDHSVQKMVLQILHIQCFLFYRYAIIGDCLEASGLNPPSAATVIFDSNANDYRGSRLLERPKGYSIMWQDTVGKKEKRLNIYRPIPETGYVAMGYVAVVGPHPPSLELVR